jgi:hypothetical protein
MFMTNNIFLTPCVPEGEQVFAGVKREKIRQKREEKRLQNPADYY